MRESLRVHAVSPLVLMVFIYICDFSLINRNQELKSFKKIHLIHDSEKQESVMNKS